MTKKLTIITVIAVFSFLWISSEAFSGVPPWQDPFANPNPTYNFDWAFGTGTTAQANNGQWYDIGLYSQAGQSRGDGSSYTNPTNNYWTSGSGTLNGFSLSNSIGDWIEAIGTGQATIRYSIREDYSSAGSVDNSDIIELFDNESEWIRIKGTSGGTLNTLGVVQTANVTSLEWNPDFDDENLNFQHYYAVQGFGPPDKRIYQPNVYVGRNMDDEAVYTTFGARANLSGGDLYRTYRATGSWEGPGNGWTSPGGWNIAAYVAGRSENLSEDYNKRSTFDGTNWYMPITVDSVEYMQRMDLPYIEGDFPASSGAVIQWYDDYDLYLSGDIPNPGGYGVSGRYILERNTLLVAKSQNHWAHAADVCYEARTYEPIQNADGPNSPYEWVYDASGDMYVPTNGGHLPGDTAAERAWKLIGNHPAFPDDDTIYECEYATDKYIWNNQDIDAQHEEGNLGRNLLVDSWRLAGLMLGQEFWNVPLTDYFWSGEMGAVCTRTYENEFVKFGNTGRLPIWTWDSVASEWVLPDTYNLYVTHAYAYPWGWAEHYTDTPVAGYDELNNFMKFVFDIDALVVEDVDGDGEFDVGDDYILFSVVDDGLYSKYAEWGESYGDTSTLFDGAYFDGDTIFLYDGSSVTTYFDAATGIFFGHAISTATGYEGVTLWAMGDLMMDIEALDIGILPEPSTIFLMIGSASGLAVVAGIMRRKLR